MNKLLSVAWREFSATVFTKGFLIGIVMTPVMLGISVFAVAAMKGLKGPAIEGEIAVIDQSGAVAPLVQANFSEKADRAEAEQTAEEVRKVVESKMGDAAKIAGPQADAAAAAAVAAGGAKLTIKVLPPDADLEIEKKPVSEARIRRTDEKAAGPLQRVALVVIPPAAVSRGADGSFGEYQTYYAPKLDFEVQERINRRVGAAIVDARVTGDPRFQAGKLSPKDVRDVLDRPRLKSVTVSKEGEKSTRGELAMLVPLAFMILLMMSTMISSQSLLTSTVEEKNSRVMEVLLSAVSPMQLMAGKILGQLGVGLIVLVFYAGFGVVGLIAAALKDLVDPIQLVYLLIYFLISYSTIACMMAAIGSVVNDMREAQTLLGPIMMIIMLPWLCWFFIQRAPNSTLSTALSFTPLINPWVMVLRLSGSEPVPAWQIPASIAIGLTTVTCLAWAAAKIFRIGVLMYGKPPNFSTLIRWIRMA